MLEQSNQWRPNIIIYETKILTKPYYLRFWIVIRRSMVLPEDPCNTRDEVIWWGHVAKNYNEVNRNNTIQRMKINSACRSIFYCEEKEEKSNAFSYNRENNLFQVKLAPTWRNVFAHSWLNEANKRLSARRSILGAQ